MHLYHAIVARRRSSTNFLTMHSIPYTKFGKDTVYALRVSIFVRFGFESAGSLTEFVGSR